MINASSKNGRTLLTTDGDSQELYADLMTITKAVLERIEQDFGKANACFIKDTILQNIRFLLNTALEKGD